MKNVRLIKSMYPCQNVPAVIFGGRCPLPCLYCGLYKYEFLEEKTLAMGIEDVVIEMSKYKGAYLSPVTDCFLPENSEITHYLLEETWKLNPIWVPLVNTKQIIPERTIELLIQNKERLVLQVSVPSIDEEIISILEPGSASIRERFEVIKKVTNAGVPVIVVIMPWFDLSNVEDLARKISETGVLRVIVSNGILTNRTKERMINSKNKKLIQTANSVCLLKDATENGFVLPRVTRIESLAKLSNSFNNFGLKVKVCISDNHDLEGSGLPLCGKFNHKNFK
jgi:DNA repair photolyase